MLGMDSAKASACSNSALAWIYVGQVLGAFRRAGFANIAHARRYYGRDDQRILALYPTWPRSWTFDRLIR
jgi:hypothetical protein